MVHARTQRRLSTGSYTIARKDESPPAQQKSEVDRDALHTLLKRAKIDGGDAIGTVLQQYRNYLAVLAGTQIGARLQRRVSTSDVVQETMLSVARHMPSFKYDGVNGSFKTWLLNMTRWRIRDQIRRRKSLPERRPLSDETSTGTRTLDKVVDPSTENLSAFWEAEWEKNLLEAAITNVKRSVDPQKYQIFDLYVKKEWSSDKVASVFGIPVGQVYLAKHRVSELIKQEVKRLRAQVT